jgi:hypothetical protein
MELSSFGIFGLAILCYFWINREDEYISAFWSPAHPFLN